MRARGFGLSAETSTIGVLPMRSRTESYAAMTSAAKGTRRSPLDHHLLFRLLAFADDAVRAQHRFGFAQRDDHVVPTRIGRLVEIGGRWIRVRVRVAVHDTEERVTAFFRVAVGAQEVATIDLVDLRRLRGVATRIEDVDAVADTGEQAAHLERIAVEREPDHLEIGLLRKSQHRIEKVAIRRPHRTRRCRATAEPAADRRWIDDGARWSGG